MKKNTFNTKKSVAQSSYLHGIVPFLIKEVVPNGTYAYSNKYYVNVDVASEQILSKMNAHFMHVFVPYEQIWTDFYKFYNNVAGVYSPFRNFDLVTNTDKTKLTYHLLPQTPATYTFTANMLPYRAYQKAIFDIFLQKYFRLSNILADTNNIWEKISGGDSTTDVNTKFAPFVDDYYNQIIAQIKYGGTATSITSPFSWDDLKSALMLDNFATAQRKFGTRLRDFIDKLFDVKRPPQDSVEIVNYYSAPLIINDIVNTADDQGKIVSKVYGITPKVNFSWTSREFGLLLGMYYVTIDDVAVTCGISDVMEYQGVSNFYKFFHPEVQGLAYEDVKHRNLNVRSATPDTVLGYTEIYNRLRQDYSQGLGDFGRETSRANQIPHIHEANLLTNGLIDIVYPIANTFAHLFPANTQQTQLYARIECEANIPVAKVLKETELVREFDQPVIL